MRVPNPPVDKIKLMVFQGDNREDGYHEWPFLFVLDDGTIQFYTQDSDGKEVDYCRDPRFRDEWTKETFSVNPRLVDSDNWRVNLQFKYISDDGATRILNPCQTNSKYMGVALEALELPPVPGKVYWRYAGFTVDAQTLEQKNSEWVGGIHLEKGYGWSDQELIYHYFDGQSVAEPYIDIAEMGDIKWSRPPHPAPYPVPESLWWDGIDDLPTGVSEQVKAEKDEQAERKSVEQKEREAFANISKEEWAEYTTEHRIAKAKTLPLLSEADVAKYQQEEFMCLGRLENLEYGLVIELKDKNGFGEGNYLGISPEAVQFERDVVMSGSEWDWKYEERRRVWDAIQSSEAVSDVSQSDRVVAAVQVIKDRSDDSEFTKSGKPRVDATSKQAGQKVTGKQRDAAWETLNVS